MSYTVVLDEAERERRFINHLNEIVRHCRIGGVRAKARPEFKPGQPFKGLPPAKQWFHDPMKPAPTPFFSGGYVHISRTDGVPA